MPRKAGRNFTTKTYSVELFKNILGRINYIRHKRETSYWDLVFARTNLLDVGSTSVIRSGNRSYNGSRLLDKIRRQDDAAAIHHAYSTIENLIMESFFSIDPQYRVYVYDLYLKPDKRRLRNSPAAEAERYGYDRRKFVPQLNNALEEAVRTAKVKCILDDIKNIALENGITELINLYVKEEEQ